MGRCALVVVLAIGCGRLRFDSSPDGAITGDIGVADTAGDGVSPACTAELCEDFETPGFKPVWTLVGAPSISRDTTIFHGGTASAHFTTPALGPNIGWQAFLVETATLPLDDPTFYVRAFVRFGAMPANSNGMEIFAAYQMAGGGFEDALFVKNNTLELYEQWTDRATSDMAAPALDTWLCLIWYVTRATSNTGMETLAGDAPSSVLAGVPTDGSPPLSILGFGIDFAATNQTTNQPSIDLWIDDIIIDKNPISCPP